MPAARPDAPPATLHEPALTALEAALSVVFPSAAGVEVACAALGASPLLRADAARSDLLRRLDALIQTRKGDVVRPLVALLCEAAVDADEPWRIVEVLLGSRIAETCAQGLDTALRLFSAGVLSPDLALAASLARVAGRHDSPLTAPACVERTALLLRQLAPPTTDDEDALEGLVAHAGAASLRRLSARALDAAGRRPRPALAGRALGAETAATLAPLLDYTRATYHDLQALVLRPGTGSPVAACVRRASASCAPALVADLVAEIGWTRLNLGFDVQRHVGVSVDGSLPFDLFPAMVPLLEAVPGARRDYDRLVVVAHGGSAEGPEATPGGDALVDRFRASNLAHAEVLGDILDVSPLTPERVRTILRKMDGIVQEFAAMFAQRSGECAALPGVFASLKQGIEAELDAAALGAPLSSDLTRLVQMFEDPPSLARVRTLHGLKRYLHQRGLALGFGLLESSGDTNRTVDLAIATHEKVLGVTRRIEYVDFDPEPSEGEGGNEAPAVPYAVAIVGDAFARHLLAGVSALPRVRVFCYGNEVHYFVSFRNHPVFIRVDYSPPLGGGMIDLAYYGVSKFEIAAHPALALEGIQTFLRRLDFFVEVDTTRIHARYDKERARDLADVCAKAEALFRLVPWLMDVDWTIGGLELPADAKQRVGEAWADLFARWGVLPVDRLLTADHTGVLAAVEPLPEGRREVRWSGEGPYTDLVSQLPGPGTLATVHAALAARGIHLPFVDREQDTGQVSMEAHLLAPLRSALARGEIVGGPGGPAPAPRRLVRHRHEADRFAELLASGPEEIAASARMARLVAALERTLTFETTGTVNGYEVQRAELVLRGARSALYGLRDADGMFRLALHAAGGAIFLTRRTPDEAWHDNASCDVGALAALLRRNNFLPSWIDAPGHEPPEVRGVLDTFARPNPHGGGERLRGARTVTCLTASPGRAAGLARLGAEGRRPEDLDGGVLVTATLRPEDQPLIRHASAVVGTGGGILSHAGLMAVQSGRPAVIAPADWRRDAGGQQTLVYSRVEFDEHARTVAGLAVVERARRREFEERVREGDLLVVDADRGRLHVLGQSPHALALHEGLRGLRDAGLALARAAGPGDVLAQRGRRLRAAHELERLAERLIDPALVEHAVRELLNQSATLEDTRPQARLLGLLAGAPATAVVATAVIQEEMRQVERRAGEAREAALRLIPRACTPDEVMALHREALRLAGWLRAVRALVSDACLHVPAGTRQEEEAEVERAAAGRLRAILEGLVRQIDSAAPDPAPGPARRHALALASELAILLQVTGPERQLVESAARELAARDEVSVRALAPRLVLWPADGGLELESLAGAKAANLAELGRLGASTLVPPWFVVTDRALQAALDAPAPPRPGTPWSGQAPRSLREAIDAVVRRGDADAEQKASLVRQLWLDVRLPEAVSREVLEAYRGLDPGESLPVAIRSSAREEDTHAAPRAGEFDTFLFVSGERALLDHLRLAWSGLWTARAIRDRDASERAALGEGGGVIVQRAIESRVSGVLQTTNVAGRRTREMVVDAGLGLGEGVVSGRVAADHAVISKDHDPATGPLRFRYVTADKRARVVRDHGAGAGTTLADVLSHQRLRPVLEYVELLELARVAVRLEAAYGYALDVEFGFDETRLWLFQVRPVGGGRAL